MFKSSPISNTPASFWHLDFATGLTIFFEEVGVESVKNKVHKYKSNWLTSQSCIKNGKHHKFKINYVLQSKRTSKTKKISPKICNWTRNRSINRHNSWPMRTRYLFYFFRRTRSRINWKQNSEMQSTCLNHVPRTENTKIPKLVMSSKPRDF